MGGLARKATIIDKCKAEGNELIIVDSGDLFFVKSKVALGEPFTDKDSNNEYTPGEDFIDLDRNGFYTDSDLNIDQYKIRADIIVDCYNEMNYDAFSPGEKDFALGVSYLKMLQSKTNFDFVSCNIYDKNNKRLFAEYKIDNLNGYKVAYVGAVSSFNRDSIVVKEPISEIKRTIDTLKERSDYIILLFNGTDSDIRRLQKSEIDGIDIILRSKGTSRASENGGTERIPVLSSGTKGKYLNRIDVMINDKKKDFVDIHLENRVIEVSEGRLEKKKKGEPNANLDEIYKDNQKVLNDITYHRKKINKSRDKLSNAVNTIDCKKIPLNKKVDSKAKILMIVDEGMVKIPKGPDIPDHKGRLPGDPHHGHSH